MNATLTIQDLFKLILFLLGIGALTYLILILKNLNKIISKADTIMESNVKEIDSILKQLPNISENVQSITKNVDNVLEELAPEINSTVCNINEITKDISSMTDSIENTTHKAYETFDIVAESISETAFSFQNNIKNFDGYLKLILDIIDSIKNIIKKR
jgi:septation ring formation regulator EzrA